jgi:hypothetical protein
VIDSKQAGYTNSKDVMRCLRSRERAAKCKPICKLDGPEWDETGQTEQNERAVPGPIRRGYRIRERSSETPETYVVVLITQRRTVRPVR